MSEHLTYAPLGADASFEAFFDLDDLTFHGTTPPERRASLSQGIPREGTLCAYDADRLVGSSAVWPLRLSVPGGQLACGAVSWVGVAPTHRRRGILTAMVGSQLARLGAAGTPLAALWGSEATIYGRFGFGVATWSHAYDIRTRDADSGLLTARADLPVRLIDADQAREVLAGVYERAAALRAGVLSRDEPWWTHGVLADPAHDPQANRLRIAIAGDPPDGYVIYRAGRDDDAPSGAWGVLEVEELVAVRPAAVQALWGYLLSVDLVGRIKAPLRPVDDPLALMLRNLRTATRTEHDALWVRLLDLPSALTGRDWNGSEDLVLEVDDGLIDTNAGRWALSINAGRAECARTDRPADLALSIAQLATIYLGGGSLTRARDAGLIAEPTPGAAERLDHAARTARAPWNVSVF